MTITRVILIPAHLNASADSHHSPCSKDASQPRNPAVIHKCEDQQNDSRQAQEGLERVVAADGPFADANETDKSSDPKRRAADLRILWINQELHGWLLVVRVLRDCRRAFVVPRLFEQRKPGMPTF